MKIAVFFMAIMVICICPGSISEEKHLASEPRHSNCRFPKGKHGSVRTDGCIKSTCSYGKWKPKLRTDICCYKQQVHKPNTVLDTIVSADNCSSTTIGCGAVGQLEFNHKSCSDPASKEQVEQLEMNLEQKIEGIENVTETSGKRSEEIYKTVREADKKIISIENKVDDLKNNTNWQSEKFNHVIQKIENNKISIENNVDDLSRKLENQTEKIAEKIQNINISIENNSDNLSDKINNVVQKIENYKISIENNVDDLSRKLENQTEKIAEKIQKMNISIEDNSDDLSDKMNNVVQKIENNKISIESHVNDLSNEVSRKLENQKQQIQTLENNVQEILENQAEKIEDLTNSMDSLTQMSMQMMTTLLNLTQLMDKHSEAPMVEGVLITGGTGDMTSTELFLPHTGKTCSLQSLPDSRFLHSIDVVSNKIILCGGLYTETSCLEFLPTSSTGSWAYYATLAQGRNRHTSHGFQEELLMLGGDASRGTTEIIGKGAQYNLQQETAYACSIPDHAATIITGGYNSGSGLLKTVVKYDLQGFVKNLPDLATARHGHGCGSYMDNGNKVLVVAGGSNGVYLSSTELLLAGATAWTSGKSLPRTLNFPASVNIDGYFLLIGGSSGQVLKFNGTWTAVGMMKSGGKGAGATKIEIPGEVGLLDITACY